MKIWHLGLLFFSTLSFGQSYSLAVHQADSMTRRYANQIFNRAAVVGVFYQGNDTIIAKGHINSLGRKADANDVFQMGSVTKTMTGFMLSKKLLDSTFSFDDKISPYIHIKNKSKFDSVTIRHLITHTSGLPHVTVDYLGPTFWQAQVLASLKTS